MSGFWSVVFMNFTSLVPLYGASLPGGYIRIYNPRRDREGGEKKWTKHNIDQYKYAGDVRNATVEVRVCVCAF